MQVAETKPKILVVEADQDLVEIISTHLREEGYEVMNASLGEAGLHACQEDPPSLVVLAVRLPDMDGFEVARRLRLERRTQDVPIIFLNEKSAPGERLQGLEIGADDYLTKPVDIQELQLRARNALRRASRGTLTNPVSGLPEGALVDEKLKEILKEGDWSILLVSLYHLEKFRDAYGFVAADDVLRAVAMTTGSILRAERGPGDFIGHLTASDIIALVPGGEAGPLAEPIRSRIEPALENFYPMKDREQLEELPDRLSIRTWTLDLTRGKHDDIAALKGKILGLKN